MNRRTKDAEPGMCFGRLTVTELRPNGKRRCLCACGRTLDVQRGELLSGAVTSCGRCEKGSCRYNVGVACFGYVDAECRVCGWNPLVEHRRKKKLWKGETSNEHEDQA